jgi:hypothetical protein
MKQGIGSEFLDYGYKDGRFSLSAKFDEDIEPCFFIFQLWSSLLGVVKSMQRPCSIQTHSKSLQYSLIGDTATWNNFS